MNISVRVIYAFINATSVEEGKNVVEQYPELLLPEADLILQKIAELQPEERARLRVESFRDLLTRCRLVGVEQAFAEISSAMSVEELVSKISPTDVKHLLTFLGSGSNEELKEFLKTHPQLRQLARNPEAIRKIFNDNPELFASMGVGDFGSSVHQYSTDYPPEFDDEIGRIHLLEIALHQRPEVARQLICIYIQLIRRLRKGEHESFRAGISHNIGTTYTQLHTGNTAKNLKRAIRWINRGLQYNTPERSGFSYAMMQNGLAGAYAQLPLGDRGDNLMKAINAHMEALRFYTPESAPLNYGVVQNDLGETYINLPIGDRQENIRKAISCYQEAAKYIDPRKDPIRHATAQNNLGSAYNQLAQLNPGENVELAIKHFEKALEFRDENTPIDYGVTLCGLATAYAQRQNGNCLENLQTAIDCFQAAAQFLRLDNAPLWYARVQNNLGSTYIVQMLEGPTDTRLEAVQAYKEALQVYTPRTHPLDCRRTAVNLGNLYYELMLMHSAYEAYALAIEAAEQLFHSSYVPVSQQVEIAINEELYRRMVKTCLILSGEEAFAREAFIYAEAGKARTFLDQMGQSNFPPPNSIPPKLLDMENELLLELRQVETNLSGQDQLENTLSLARRRQEIRSCLNTIWDEIEDVSPEAGEYVAYRRAAPPTWQDLTKLSDLLGPETVIVQFYLLEKSIAAFVLRSGWDAPGIFHVPLTRDELHYKYFRIYEEEVLRRSEFAAFAKPTHSWLKLGEEILAPLESALDGVVHVYFVPHEVLHLIPLHALTVNGEPFIKKFSVTYAPSSAVLNYVMRRQPSARSGDSALVLGYTANADPLERDLFLNEAKSVAKQLQAEFLLLDEEATGEALRNLAPQAHHVHLSCHGLFGSNDPLASHIKLADGDFTGRDWMRMGLSADLVTVSACESGISEVRRGDEIVGLSRAILYSGVSTTLLTLWSVEAETTKQWMESFYKLSWDPTNGKQQPEASAYRSATLTLMAQKDDPFYWAPFILVGDWR